MAILNLKNLPDVLYKKLQARISHGRPAAGRPLPIYPYALRAESGSQRFRAIPCALPHNPGLRLG
jgi:hypothetical protein